MSWSELDYTTVWALKTGQKNSYYTWNTCLCYHISSKTVPIFGPSCICSFHGLKAGGLAPSGTDWPGLGLRTLRNFWLSVRSSAMCSGSGESTEPVHVRLSVLWEMAALLGLIAGVPPGDLYLTHIHLITKNWHNNQPMSSVLSWQLGEKYCGKGFPWEMFWGMSGEFSGVKCLQFFGRFSQGKHLGECPGEETVQGRCPYPHARLQVQVES